MLKASEAGLSNHQSEVDAASKAAGEGDLVEDGGVGEQDADNAEAQDCVDELIVRVDTPELAQSVTKASSVVSASKASVVSSLKRQL